MGPNVYKPRVSQFPSTSGICAVFLEFVLFSDPNKYEKRQRESACALIPENRQVRNPWVWKPLNPLNTHLPGGSNPATLFRFLGITESRAEHHWKLASSRDSSPIARTEDGAEEEGSTLGEPVS